MSDNDTAYGVFGVIVVVALVGWAFISNAQQQQKERNTETVSSAVSDINYKIDELYSSATDTYSSIEDECSWQADNLSGNIGDVCSNNTVESYTIESEDEYQLDEADYASIIDQGDSIDSIIEQVVSDANDRYNKLLDTTNSMVSALNDQCDWIENNIDDSIASECYDAGSAFEGYSESPFDAYDYTQT